MWAKDNVLMPFFVVSIVYVSIQIISCGRLFVYSVGGNKIEQSSGTLQIINLPRGRGSEINLINNGMRTKYSCASPGIKEYSGCISSIDKMNGKVVAMDWTESPIGLLNEIGRHPLKIAYLNGDDVVIIADSPSHLFLEKAKGKAMLSAASMAAFFFLFLLIRKILNLKPRR